MTDVSKTITSGTVSVEDGTKAKEEFAPARKARVELSFSVPEGADGVHFLNGVSKIADDKLAEILGRKPAEKRDTIVVKPAAAEAPKPETAAEKKARVAAEKEAAKPPGKTKADLEKEMLAAAAKPAADPVIPADDSDDILPDDDNLDDILGEPAPDPITDKQLSDACVAKADKMKSVAGWEPKKIRSLIEKFTGAPGKHNREIPAAKRPDFLKELDALK